MKKVSPKATPSVPVTTSTPSKLSAMYWMISFSSIALRVSLEAIAQQPAQVAHGWNAAHQPQRNAVAARQLVDTGAGQIVGAQVFDQVQARNRLLQDAGIVDAPCQGGPGTTDDWIELAQANCHTAERVEGELT